MQAVGSLSLGFMMYVLPQMSAMGNIHSGIMAGKLKGAMPAQTPRGVLGGEGGPAPEAGEVHVLADPLQVLAHHEVGDAAGLLHHLQPAHHVALRVRQRLALGGGQGAGPAAPHLLHSDQLGDVLQVLLDQLLVLEHDLLPGEGGGAAGDLARGEDWLQVRPAALADSTACSISSAVHCGTLVTTWLVAGLCTSIQESVVLSSHWPPTTSWVVGGTRPPE